LNLVDDCFVLSRGVVLLRVCGGREPFDGHNTMAVLAALAVATPRPVREVAREVPEGLSDFVSRLLHRDPTQRPASAEQVIEELKSLASDVKWPQLSAVVRPSPAPVAASVPEPPPRRRSSRKKRQHRPSFLGWPWIAGGAGAVLLAVIIVVACWPPRGTPLPQPYGPEHGNAGPGPIEPVNPVDPKEHVVFLTQLTPAEHDHWYSSPPAPPRPPPP